MRKKLYLPVVLGITITSALMVVWMHSHNNSSSSMFTFHALELGIALAAPAGSLGLAFAYLMVFVVNALVYSALIRLLWDVVESAGNRFRKSS